MAERACIEITIDGPHDLADFLERAAAILRARKCIRLIIE